MKIVFAGTPAFALPTLQALIASKHEITGVYTQPDRPQGRGRHAQASPVKTLALQHGLTVFQPESLHFSFEQQRLAELKPDLIVVTAYGLLLPQAVLDIPRYGCLNVHASLLPALRGAAPIQGALLKNFSETGITIMQMDAGLDTGAMWYKIALPIDSHDNVQTLHDRLAQKGAEALMHVLNHCLLNSALRPEIQDPSQASYAPKIKTSEKKLDFKNKAENLSRAVRAYYPAYAFINNLRLQIWEAQALPLSHAPPSGLPGEIIQIHKDSLDVLTGKGILKLLKIQFPGGKKLIVKDILLSKTAFFEKNRYFN